MSNESTEATRVQIPAMIHLAKLPIRLFDFDNPGNNVSYLTRNN